jgi:prevent-host-death family protein
MKSVSIAEGRRRLAELIREAEAGRSVTLLRRGKPVAVLMSASTYNRLERVAAYLEALEISARLAAYPGIPNAVEVARAAREELEEHH